MARSLERRLERVERIDEIRSHPTTAQQPSVTARRLAEYRSRLQAARESSSEG